MKILLIVEDESGILETLVEILSDEGFTVLSAHNGREALQRLSEGRPDLVLLDYMMPVMDGAETLRAMQADTRYHDIPVLMMSAVPRTNLPSDCRPAAFLGKPFDLGHLLSEIRRLVATAS